MLRCVAYLLLPGTVITREPLLKKSRGKEKSDPSTMTGLLHILPSLIYHLSAHRVPFDTHTERQEPGSMLSVRRSIRDEPLAPSSKTPEARRHRKPSSEQLARVGEDLWIAGLSHSSRVPAHIFSRGWEFYWAILFQSRCATHPWVLRG